MYKKMPQNGEESVLENGGGALDALRDGLGFGDVGGGDGPELTTPDDTQDGGKRRRRYRKRTHKKSKKHHKKSHKKHHKKSHKKRGKSRRRR